MFGRPKRTVPKPEAVTSHKSANPMFHEPTSPDLHRFRQRVLLAFGAVIILLLLGFVVYGPWLAVTTIEVAGTRALNPNSVKSVTRAYLAGQSLLILPRRNLWLVSGRQLSDHLKQKISAKLSIEAVRVTKQYPHRIVITITERTPVFLWTNGTDSASIDRQGVLIELRHEPDPALDLVRDGLATSIQPDQQVLVPEVADKLLDLQSALRRNNFTVKEFIIPMPVCPLLISDPATIIEAGQNSNINDSNINAEKPELQPTNGNINAPEAPPCDLIAWRQKSQEIHVQLKDGALVLFDRHSNIDGAVTTLTRLLSQPENIKATYIDVRFEERAYIR